MLNNMLRGGSTFTFILLLLLLYSSLLSSSLAMTVHGSFFPTHFYSKPVFKTSFHSSHRLLGASENPFGSWLMCIPRYAFSLSCWLSILAIRKKFSGGNLVFRPLESKSRITPEPLHIG